MHLGLTPWNFAELSAANLTEQARFAETLGYESFWLPENHFNDRAIPEPLMLLAAVAAGTKRIALATTSYLLPLRHPLFAAEQVAVLDRLSNGRVLLGVGRGYSNAVLQAFNVDPAGKRAQFEWVLEIMIRAWSGEPVSVDPDNIAPVVLDPLPVQKPHPPIWVAAFGPKALAQVGRLGLPYLASPIETINQLKTNAARHRQSVEEAGHDAIAACPIMRTIFVSKDQRELRELRDRLASSKLATGAQAPPDVDEWAVIGEPNFVQDKIGMYQKVLNMTHLIVTRLRLDGIEESRLRDSVAAVPELIN